MPGEGGGVYQNGTKNVKGKVIIKENNRVELTQGGGNVGGTNPDPTPIHQSNVHLPETSTKAPLKKVVTVVGGLAQDSGIGVLTNTSPEETDTGTIYTLLRCRAADTRTLPTWRPTSPMTSWPATTTPTR